MWLYTLCINLAQVKIDQILYLSRDITIRSFNVCFFYKKKKKSSSDLIMYTLNFDWPWIIMHLYVPTSPNDLNRPARLKKTMYDNNFLTNYHPSYMLMGRKETYNKQLLCLVIALLMFPNQSHLTIIF